MTMESAMLKEIVLPPTLMRKLLNVAGVSGYVPAAEYRFHRADRVVSRRQQQHHSQRQYHGVNRAYGIPIMKSTLIWQNR
jgi:hypothetical protein